MEKHGNPWKTPKYGIYWSSDFCLRKWESKLDLMMSNFMTPCRTEKVDFSKKNKKTTPKTTTESPKKQIDRKNHQKNRKKIRKKTKKSKLRKMQVFFFLFFPWFWFSSLFFLFTLVLFSFCFIFFCQTLYSLCCWTHNHKGIAWNSLCRKRYFLNGFWKFRVYI